MVGNLAVINDIKNAPNKIIIPCRSIEHGEEIISKIKSAMPGEKLFFINYSKGNAYSPTSRMRFWIVFLKLRQKRTDCKSINRKTGCARQVVFRLFF